MLEPLSPFAVLSTLYSVLSTLLATFPRGPGFYFHPVKFLALLFLYLCWVRTCGWVDHDAEQLGLPRYTWNLILFGCGLLGLIVVWLLPWFLISFTVLLILYVAPSLAYANLRNQLVPDDRQVLTGMHFRSLAQRYLGLDLGPRKPKKQKVGPPLRFLGKSANQSTEDPARVARAESSRGARAAREMVYEAICARATDIHLEPTREEMQVRFRIDGILQPTAPFGRTMGESVVNMFKVLAAMDIAEKRKPQDGGFAAEVEDRRIDFRVATAGSVAGEKLVLRIFDRSQQIVDLRRLGMPEAMREQIRRFVAQPHGMLIVCGPTGAGKTTTQYACLNEIDRYQRNVITIENPVEHQLANVTQIEVNLKAGKTFASELRSVLRQDPDVILIGEIRDQETAEIACQAAQTGHMVFTTLHANDTVTALGRLNDLGVQPFMIANAVNAVLGQRLVRLLCPDCKVRYKPTVEQLHRVNLSPDAVKYLYRPPEPGEWAPPQADRRTRDEEEPAVCEHCGGTGYHGRTGIFELLVLSDAVRALIRQSPNLDAIRQAALEEGMTLLQQDGLRKVMEGTTALEELLRVSK